MAGRLSVDIGKDMDELINQLAKELDISRSDVVRRGVKLLEGLHEREKKGQELGYLKEGEFVGCKFI